MRGASKASQYYQNSSWDLVDALDRGIVVLERLSDDALPLAIRGMSLAQKQEYVAAKRAERKAIQATIQDLYQKRTEYIEKQRQASANNGENTLDSVIIESLRKQLAVKDLGFSNSWSTIIWTS
jgi:hypothetical protein